MPHTVCNIVTKICKQKHTHTLICNLKLGLGSKFGNYIINLDGCMWCVREDCEVADGDTSRGGGVFVKGGGIFYLTAAAAAAALLWPGVGCHLELAQTKPPE